VPRGPYRIYSGIAFVQRFGDGLAKSADFMSTRKIKPGGTLRSFFPGGTKAVSATMPENLIASCNDVTGELR
jgi:hypothetical protein